jgi:hypothetical protein
MHLLDVIPALCGNASQFRKFLAILYCHDFASILLSFKQFSDFFVETKLG